MKLKYEYVTDKRTLRDVINALSSSNILYIDTETTEKEIRLIQIGNDEDIFVIDLFEIPESVEVIKDLFKKKGIVGHNLKFDIKYLSRYGIFPVATFDTMVASQLLRREKHSLAYLAYSFLGINMDKSYQLSNWASPVLSKGQVEYAALDVEVLRSLFPILRDKLNEISMEHPLLKTRTARLFGLRNPAAIIEMAFVKEVAKLELNGFPVDVGRIETIGKEIERKKQKLIIGFITKYRIDPMSPRQVGKFLKDRGFNLPETAKGNIATDDKVLSEYAGYEEVDHILEIRKLKKYADKIEEIRSNLKGRRVYPEFKQIGAITGRMSSSNPNVQNIPRDMRNLFKAEEGNTFVIADFSQIELRIAAEYVNDPLMTKAFIEGKDLHTYTASVILDKREDEVTKEDRQSAKAVNFGLIYGISAKGLALYAKSSYGINMSVDEAETIREKFFKHFYSFKRWHEEIKRKLREEKEVKGETLLGRPYVAYTFNDATNYPIQGTGADILKLSVLLFDMYISKEGVSAKVVNLVHDEIVVECRKEDAEKVRDILERAMREAGRYALKRVPVEVESVISEVWEK